MSGPFPGMDPWLEEPGVWVGVHPRLLTYIADSLQPLLGNRYVAAIEERVYVASVERLFVPDVQLRRGDYPARATSAVVETDDAVLIDIGEVETHERFIEIRDLQSGEEVVAVIEVVSPSNKRSGTGREKYLTKQREALNSQASLVEIDLLRGGAHLVAVPEIDAKRVKDYDYLVSIHQARETRRQFKVYPRTIRESLPRVLIPLNRDEASVPLDIQSCLNQLYDAGNYAHRLNYMQPCYPRLRKEDEAWAQERIRAWQAAAQA